MVINKYQAASLRTDFSEVLRLWINQRETYIADRCTDKEDALSEYRWLDQQAKWYIGHVEAILGPISNKPEVFNPYDE